MAKLKEFSILKWVLFPLNSIVLAGVVVWFNMRVFGYADGAPYCAIVVLIGMFSIVVVKYAESTDKTLARAAFIFEIFLTSALVINAAYSISVQRKMSVARMAESSQKDTIGEISKLRGSRTQREALQKLDKPVAAQSIFADVEGVLFGIAVGELFLYGVAAFSLFALARLRDDDDDEEVKEEFPKSLKVENRVSAKRENFTAKKEPTKNHGSFNPEGLKRLREALKDISFRLAGYSFKSSVKDDCVWIFLMKARHGTQETVSSAQAELSMLNDAVRLPREKFRQKLELFLTDHGFEIE